MMRRLFRPALFLVGAACIAATWPSYAPLWPEVPAESADPGTFPESAMILRGAIGEALGEDDRAAVARGAGALADMGGGLSLASRARIAPFLTPERAAAFAKRFDENVEPVMRGTLETEVPAEHRIVEGLAWDAATRRLFAGTVVDGHLLVREGRMWRRVALEGPVGGLFGMAIDERRRLLWLTSGAAQQVANPARAFRGLIAVDLDRLAVVRRVPLPAGDTGSPGDLTLARDGTVYVSNGETGAIHVCAPGCGRLSDLIPGGRLRNPQGLVLTRDGRRLYIADYGYGLAVYDLPAGRLSRLVARKPMMLDGIDGLIGYRGDLIAIQNGTNPRRIIRLVLNGDGHSVRSLAVLGRADPDWGEPTLGVVAGRHLLFVADGQWERYAARGGAIDREPPRPTPVRALRLAD